MNPPEKIILGIDPGTNVMGYGVLKVVGNKAAMVSMGVIDMRKMSDPYLKLGYIFKRVTGVIEEYLPDELAIEAPFYGQNVQSMLKLGRAQGVAIAAAIQRDIPIHEYAPLKIKMALTGNGGASKEQVAGMLQRMLNITRMICQSSWMLPMRLLQHIAISSKWANRRPEQSIMVHGRILSRRILIDAKNNRYREWGVPYAAMENG